MTWARRAAVFMLVVAVATPVAASTRTRPAPTMAFAWGGSIETVRPDGSGYRRVAAAASVAVLGGGAGDPSWAPDGRRLTYHVSTPGLGTAVHVVDVPSARDTTIATIPYAVTHALEWAPDGAHIAVQVSYSYLAGALCWCGLSPVSQLFTVRPDGSQLSAVVSTTSEPQFPTWSPDGKQLAFQGDGAGVPGIYVVDVTASPSVPRRVSPDTSLGGSYLRWSPDGKHIAFTSSSDLASVDVLAAPQVRVLTLATKHVMSLPLRSWDRPSWSPDGRRLAVTDSQAQLHTIGYDGQGDRTLARGMQLLQPEWSPDGKLIAVLASLPRASNLLATIPASGGRLRLIDPWGFGPGDLQAERFIAWTRSPKY
ncbi:MAG: hypothetical protein LC640_05995 [Frankia sp.]|nr:hypothetical protein [Frankia sp.]